MAPKLHTRAPGSAERKTLRAADEPANAQLVIMGRNEARLLTGSVVAKT